MYLSELEENEKKTFLKIAHLIAQSNGVYEESEKNILLQFEKEMSVDFDVGNLIEESDATDMDSLLLNFKEITSKRIIFLESLILVYANDDFDDVQKQIIEKMRSTFRIDRKLYTLMSEWAKNILSLNKQGLTLIQI